jgi:hypothetical protein
MRLLAGSLIASGLLVLAACGGAAGSQPGDAVKAYLSALADNDGPKACDLLTASARASLVEESGDADCPAFVDRLHLSLGADAARLKDVEVSEEDVNGDSTTVIAELDGRPAEVALERVDGEWRIETGSVANELLGLGLSG